MTIIHDEQKKHKHFEGLGFSVMYKLSIELRLSLKKPPRATVFVFLKMALIV